MTEIPTFNAVEETNRGKTTIYWGSSLWSLRPNEAKGKTILLKGRVRTVKHLETLHRGSRADPGSYVGVSVYDYGELHD